MGSKVSRLVVGLVAIVVVLGALGLLLDRPDGEESGTGTTPAAPSSSPADRPGEETPEEESPGKDSRRQATSALAAAQQLTVKGRAPKTGYDRDEFGQRWYDTDSNGCGQRDDTLRRDMINIVTKAGTDGCVVLAGVLEDPFTGETIHFKRGNKTSTAVQVDHVVSLSDSWQKGAQQLDAATRQDFANDFLNLIAVDGPTNAAKGDGDTATWLPPNKPYRCAYVARQVAVKQKYSLWVTEAEQDAMVRVLTSCPDESLPSTESAAAPERDPSTEATAAPEPDEDTGETPKATGQPEQPDDTYYENCDEVRAAGKDPIHEGDPGYGRHLDRDGDGVGCQ